MKKKRGTRTSFPASEKQRSSLGRKKLHAHAEERGNNPWIAFRGLNFYRKPTKKSLGGTGCTAEESEENQRDLDVSRLNEGSGKTEMCTASYKNTTREGTPLRVGRGGSEPANERGRS